ncbi:TetR/AcrR family transcriptional regulator [Brenneria tiliae]|uniref:TetR/AcrR family transcriptional regulator n=1 Tax=Brenneria tiliae TaxID=2914984 RepID=A0ABT0N0N0_9GAMM|nr:TetR/AcrR family transcriptional regulator [Brenneria tiliae]MCL2895651.1 TetR/AcrR family transcriptional regulator [Brenneria tiliae]
MGTLGRGTRKRLSAEQRKAQIIGVATSLISERGYWRISLQDIATQCEITDTAVLHHFGSKERLLLAVVQYRDEADRVALAGELGVPRDELYERIPSFELFDICDAMVRRNVAQPEIIRLYALLSAESLQPDHPVHNYFFEREKQAIKTFASARIPHGKSNEALGRLMLAAMDGVQLRWLRDLKGVDLLADWQTISRTLIQLHGYSQQTQDHVPHAN